MRPEQAPKACWLSSLSWRCRFKVNQMEEVLLLGPASKVTEGVTEFLLPELFALLASS